MRHSAGLLNCNLILMCDLQGGGTSDMSVRDVISWNMSGTLC